MEAWINLYIPISDLEIDYTASRESEESEFWGNVQTHYYWDIDIRSVSYNGISTDDFDSAAIREWLIDNVLDA